MDPMVYLALTLALGTAASFAVFKLSVLLYRRVKSPLLNPLLVTVAFIIAALVALHIPLESYEQSVQLISFLLGPATVALAYSVYRQRQTLTDHFVPIFAGCLVGSVVSMTSAYALCKLLGLDDTLALSFIPKSVTTPIAIAVSASWANSVHHRGGKSVVTGILGAIPAPLMARLFRVRDGIAKGVAIGTCLQPRGGHDEGARDGRAGRCHERRLHRGVGPADHRHRDRCELLFVGTGDPWVNAQFAGVFDRNNGAAPIPKGRDHGQVTKPPGDSTSIASAITARSCRSRGRRPW